jgi:hypothetical protein
MKSSLKYEVYVEKIVRGKWHSAVFNRKGDEFCALVQNPAEPY